MIAKHMIRTLMIETPSIPGNLGRVATAIGLLGGDIGEVETVKALTQLHNAEYYRSSGE